MARVGYCYSDIYLTAICQQVYWPKTCTSEHKTHFILANPFTVILHARDGSSEKIILVHAQISLYMYTHCLSSFFKLLIAANIV